MSRPYDVAKRSLDVVGAVVGLTVLSPLIAGVAIAVAAKLGRPVIFRQQRPGRRGEIFTLYKFRTMRVAGRSGEDSDDELRLPPFGRRLRSSSLDELPSLLNILTGSLSFVGPRPLLAEYLPLYSPEQARRHEVRPGITGLAQVGGRNALSWDERFALDVEYVDTYDLLTDAKILARTIVPVLSRSGISAEGHATMGRFTGNSERRAP